MFISHLYNINNNLNYNRDPIYHYSYDQYYNVLRYTKDSIPLIIVLIIIIIMLDNNNDNRPINFLQ